MTAPEKIDRDPLVPVAGVWALLESTVFFVLPDFFVAPAVIARPRLVVRLVVVTLVGSVVGALLLAGFASAYPDAVLDLIEALPFTSADMFEEVADSTDDASSVLTQPVSGIPAKVWTWTAVSADSPLVGFFALLALARLLRFTAVAAFAWLLERVMGEWLRRHARPLLTLYVAVFFVALWLVSR